MNPWAAPEAIAQSYLLALAARDWETAANLVDEDVVLRAVTPFRGPAKQEVGNGDPGERADRDSGLGDIFAGVRSRAELAAMSPRDAFARLLAGFGAGSYEQAKPRQLVRILGSVIADGSAHVVYYSKWEFQEDSESLPRVLALRHGRTGWAVLPTADELEPSPETLFSDPFRIDW